MTKRILSLLLAAMMVLGSLVVVSAAEIDYAAENTWAVEVLSKIEVLQGDENGDPMLDNAILRYEMALFLARALTGKTDDAYWAKVENETPFDDLLTHPYNGAATWNYNHGIILGVTDTIFNPNGNITYQDAIVMVVRAWADYFLTNGLATLGIKDELHYPWKHIELADDLGLTANIDPTEKYLENTTRGVVAQLVYNLLTWYDAATLAKLDSNPLHDSSIGAAKFGLVISAKNGDKFTATEIKDGKVTLDGNPNDLKLAETEFARFNLTAKKDAVYAIVYYTIGEETVVTSIKQVSADGVQFVNTPAGRTFDVVYEATKWVDNDKTKDATEWKITGINVDGTVYSIGQGDKPLTLLVAGEATTGYATKELNAATVKAYEAILDSLYGTLDLIDANGDGTFEKIDITPYVFAALYAEVDADNKADTKPTTFQFAGYGMVAVTDATETDKVNGAYNVRSFTWTNACKDANGEYKANFECNNASAEYVAKATVDTLATATKLSDVKVNYFDVDADTKDKWVKFVGDTTEYGWGYADLLAWDIIENGKGVADYFDLARVNNGVATGLLKLFDNKNVADDKVAYGDKYANAWILDGNIVAIVPATDDGTGSTTPSTPTAVYNGIILLENLPTSVQIDGTNIKVVNGVYHLVATANVDGIEKEILLPLVEKTGFVFDRNNAESEKAQEERYYQAKLNTAYTAFLATANGIKFYTLDAYGNYKLVADKAVTGENYKTYVGGDYMVKPGTGKTATAIAYSMDINSIDFIQYTVDNTVKFINPVASAETAWLFVDTTANTIDVKTGAPEYGSEFSVADAKDIVKNGSTIVAFTSNVKGFKYTMYADADYVIYDGSAARNDMKRDGYIYFDVVDLFSGDEYTMRVDENDEATLKQLANINSKQVIIAVEHTSKHDLLEIYDIENDAIAAIASLEFGASAFKTTGVADKAALEERIAEQYNLNAINKIQMSANTANKQYLVNESQGSLDPAFYAATSTYYVFFTAPTSSAAASYVVFICE